MKWRNWHAYVGLVAFLPLLVISFTGVMLELRNQFEFIQPKTVAMEIEEGAPYLTMERVLGMFPEGSVDQVIFRPGKRNYSVRVKGGNEVQIHPQTGEVMKDLPRRSGLLIDIHQGSFLGPFGQYFIHLSAGLALVFLLISGIMIFPFHRWRKP